MRRVVVSTEGVDIEQAAVPQPGPSEVLIRSVLVGICGSDTHAVQGRHPNVRLPYHPGHEVVGVVEAAGVEVTRVLVGRRVTVEPDLPCWSCKQCTAGRQNLCEHLQFLGCGHPQGAMADFFTVDARRVHVVPDSLDDLSAALIEPLATPVHAVRLAGDVTGRTVAILGAGTIGLLLLHVARAHGARRVVVTARSGHRRAVALAHGADAVVDASAPDAVTQVRTALGESADVVFDCVAVQSTTSQALLMADKGGTVVVVGVPVDDVVVPLALVQDSQLRIQGSATYLAEDYDDAIALLTADAIPVATLVTAVRPFDEAAEAFRDAASGLHVKVLVAVGPHPPA
jgi:L-iditol 2-dehydrogenase